MPRRCSHHPALRAVSAQREAVGATQARAQARLKPSSSRRSPSGDRANALVAPPGPDAHRREPAPSLHAARMPSWHRPALTRTGGNPRRRSTPRECPRGTALHPKSSVAFLTQTTLARGITREMNTTRGFRRARAPGDSARRAKFHVIWQTCAAENGRPVRHRAQEGIPCSDDVQKEQAEAWAASSRQDPRGGASERRGPGRGCGKRRSRKRCRAGSGRLGPGRACQR
jgi:hypothetical protein